MYTRLLTIMAVSAFVLTLLLAAPAWAQSVSVEKDDNPDPVDRGGFPPLYPHGGK